MDRKFDWGDAVRISDNAPEKYLSVGKGSVCGIREIETDRAAVELGEPIGSILYLIEAPNGEAIEIPERFLIA